MKKSNALKFFAFALLAFVMASCNKYEEGSNFSFISKKSRMVNNWKMNKLEQTSGTVTADITSTVDYIELDMNDDNTYEMRTAVTVLVQLVGTETGTWAFNDDKTQVIMTESNGDIRSGTIIKLKKDELKFSYVDNSITYTIDMVTK